MLENENQLKLESEITKANAERAFSKILGDQKLAVWFLQNQKSFTLKDLLHTYFKWYIEKLQSKVEDMFEQLTKEEIKRCTN